MEKTDMGKIRQSAFFEDRCFASVKNGEKQENHAKLNKKPLVYFPGSR